MLLLCVVGSDGKKVYLNQFNGHLLRTKVCARVSA